MNSVPIKTHNIKVVHLALLVVSLILSIVGMDLLHASIKNYTFYLSESLLFGIFWLLFAPLVLMNTKVTITKKPILRLLFSSLFHIGLFSLFVYVISALFFDHTFHFYAVFVNSIAENGIICLIVYGIIGYVLFLKKQPSKNTTDITDVKKIMVRFKNQTIVIRPENIIYIQTEKPYITLVTKERKYLYNSSLKRFLTEYSKNTFIQIHKSTIINKDQIIAFNSRKNGDYDIQLTNQDIVRASRSYNTNFLPFLKRTDWG